MRINDTDYTQLINKIKLTLFHGGHTRDIPVSNSRIAIESSTEKIRHVGDLAGVPICNFIKRRSKEEGEKEKKV